MIYLVLLLSACLLVGFIGVAANPSPLYGAMGLVLAAGGACGLLVSFGGSFIGLVLFLIYLGGMLVVFAYSVALAAEPYPESWMGSMVVVYVCGYFFLVWVVYKVVEELVMSGCLGINGLDAEGFNSFRVDFSGVGILFSVGGYLLLVCGAGLVLALFVVLEIVRGRALGGLRVP